MKNSNAKSNAATTKALAKLPTTSARIRYLNAKGFKNGEIAKMLDKRPQHVRNVLITPVTNPKK